MAAVFVSGVTALLLVRLSGIALELNIPSRLTYISFSPIEHKL